MLKALHRWMLALLVAGASLHPLESSANPSLLQAEARVASAVLDWEAARVRLAQATDEQRRLAGQINTEKRKGAGRELERLLQASLVSERKLAARSREHGELANVVRRAIDEAFRKAASEFRAAKPKLSSKDSRERGAAQNTLALIQAMRGRLKEHQLALVQRSEATPKDWEKYDQKPSRNDGPEELRAKADFVADHRDKFKKKRAELLKLIEEARQERELTRLAANFQQDAFLYDENARSGRVARGSNQEILAVGNNDTNNRGGDNSPTVLAPGESNGQPQAAPSPPGPDPAAAFDDANGRGAEAPRSEGTPTTSPTPTPTAESPSLGSSVPLPREFNPTALLNLEIERIDASSVSLEQLISTLRNLEKLDELLARRESELVQKARQLEQAEKSGAE